MLPKRVGAPAGRCGGDLIALVDEESLNKKIDDADKARKWLDLPTDGLVFKLNSLKLQRELGEGVKYPRYACAFKFKEEMVATIMSGITIQIGRSGRVAGSAANNAATRIAMTMVALQSGCTENPRRWARLAWRPEGVFILDSA